MNNKVIIGIIVVLVLLGGAFVLSKNKSVVPQSTSPAQTQSAQPSSTPSQPSQATSSPTTQGNSKSFTVNADDSSADLTTINAKKGDSVSITFNVKPNNVYHAGLDFRSDQVSTGTIAPGSSKTITFTANNSFTFTPYWPSTNIAKPYTISVVIQ